MPSFIESLIGSAVQREDETRLKVAKQALPTRARDHFDTIASMGRNAGIVAFIRNLELKHAEPHKLTFATLGRWPTPAEASSIPDPYRPARHLRELLTSLEFRAAISRRLMEAFPEKQRLLLVGLPRSATGSVLKTLRGRLPLIEGGLDQSAFADADTLIKTVGEMLWTAPTTRTLAMALPTLAPFIGAASPADDPLRWQSSEPPCRPNDMLFAIMRPPLERALSQANAALTAAREDGPDAVAADIGTPPASADLPAWRALGKRLLPQFVSRNPVTTALADGTAAGTLALCRTVPLQLVALRDYPAWGRGPLGGSVAEGVNASATILRHADLSPSEIALIEERTAEDRQFYDRFAARRAAADTLAIASRTL
ncbi:MAG TPA: hypothetical protein VMB71_12575 [Acetobacteraceae bacterium]|nr:hypothetical protein [Acetobacteraceae bacterium]